MENEEILKLEFKKKTLKELEALVKNELITITNSFYLDGWLNENMKEAYMEFTREINQRFQDMVLANIHAKRDAINKEIKELKGNK